MALTSVCIGLLACALGLSALASPDAAIPLDQLGAVAGQQYQGDGLAVSATPEGAQLRCVFQRLTGRVTSEGLWLESTEPGGGHLHLRATAIGRDVVECDRLLEPSAGRARHSVRAVSGTLEGLPPLRRAEDCAPYLGDPRFVARPQPDHPARSGAAYSDRALNPGAMPLLPELEDNVWGLAFYSDVAPDGAVGPLLWDNQTLPRTGTVAVADGRVQFRRAGLVEEYTVSMDGVRQDFIVEGETSNIEHQTSNPECRVGELRVELELTGAQAEALPNGVRLTLDGSGRELAYSRLRVTDATGKELPARMEIATHSAFRVPHSAFGLAVLVDDTDAVYPVRVDPTFSDADWVSLSPGGIPGVNDGWINAVATDAYGNVYIGGEFTFAGTVAANYIAKWDGSAWWPLGSGMNGSVSALATSGTNLYAGGAFTTAGGVTANRIAKWDGSSWSALGSGMNSYVYALAVSDSDLYAGGSFTTAGDVPANYIAKWDGNTWFPWGWGMNGSVFALAVSGANIYAGGSFTTADGLTANRIAQWDGSSWSALGSGMDSSTSALALDDAGHLFVGGDFYYAGDKLSPYLAQANLTPPPMVIEGIRVEAGVVTLNCRGAAGAVCAVQRATDVRFTQNLTTLHTTNAPPDGRFTCTDSTPPATTAFYRLRQP